MRLSREKIVRISHLAVDVIAGFDEVEFIEDRNTVRLDIIRVMNELLREEEQMEEAAREKITSQKRDIPEGSSEWETLYRKYYDDEMKKRGVARQE
jgi:hypothetical protein